MTDAHDDEALTWEGDDETRRRPAPRLIAEADDRSAGDRQGGPVALVALGLLGGVAALETLGWIRGVTSTAMTESLDVGTGSALAIASYVAGLVGRAAAVLAPLVWFGAAFWRIRRPATRLTWLLLGAVVLLPWPFLLGLR